MGWYCDRCITDTPHTLWSRFCHLTQLQIKNQNLIHCLSYDCILYNSLGPHETRGQGTCNVDVRRYDECTAVAELAGREYHCAHWPASAVHLSARAGHCIIQSGSGSSPILTIIRSLRTEWGQTHCNLRGLRLVIKVTEWCVSSDIVVRRFLEPESSYNPPESQNAWSWSQHLTPAPADVSLDRKFQLRSGLISTNKLILLVIEEPKISKTSMTPKWGLTVLRRSEEYKRRIYVSFLHAFWQNNKYNEQKDINAGLSLHSRSRNSS